jgi:hypothetical protein
VLVAAGLLQVGGEQLGERDLIQVVVLPGRQPRLDRGGDLPGQFREHVVRAQLRQRLHHDVPAGRLLGGQRAVIRQADHGGARRVGGELEQPRRRQPQRQLPAQLGHPLPVRVRPRGHVLRRRDEHPDRQPARLIAVPQQLGPCHRAVREQVLDPMIDNPCYLLHVRSTARAAPKVPVLRAGQC